MSFFGSDRYNYPDDIFADSRMSFGEHIEELRYYLVRALIGFGICLLLSFILDGIGTATGWPVGMGRPVLDEIKRPIESQVDDFYERRRQKIADRLEEDDADLAEPTVLKASIKTESLKPYLRQDMEVPASLPVEIELRAADLFVGSERGKIVAGANRNLTTLSAQEAMFAWIKVSLLCGVVISSPWLFWNIWGFVGAGLYPHEKKYVQVFLPFSVLLFLSGVFMCQYLVLPEAVNALLAFNEWLDLDPDIRLSEWLGFAILLPLVFGFSFQTPIFMLFFNRIGMFTVEDYGKRWRYAVMVIGVLAAMITPPDVVSMVFLLGPVFGLYVLGIWLCKTFPGDPPLDDGDEDYAV